MSYGYDDMLALVHSICPTLKYTAPSNSITLSTILGCICALCGFWPILAIAMVLVLLLEVMTGLKASNKRGEKFESAKFSRFILKLCIWFILFVSCQMFALFSRMYGGDNYVWIIGGWFFDVLTVILMMAFVVENVTSILENLASIEGKDKSHYIELIKEAMNIAVKKIFLWKR
jgi:uncharacterized membrane protein